MIQTFSNGVKFTGTSSNYIVGGHPVTIDQYIMELIIILIEKNCAVEGIKFLRNYCQIGLKEAKDLFDAMRMQYRQSNGYTHNDNA